MRAPCLVGACALLTACASSAGPGSTTAPGETRQPVASSLAKLTVSHLRSLGGQLTLWVAKDTGLFERNGLDVDLKTVEATPATGGLQSGELQVVLVGGSEALHLAAGAG